MKVNKTSPSCKGPMNEIDVDVSNGKLATENKPSSYISIQTGEEFSSEFLERLTPRAAPCEPLIAQNQGPISQNHNCQTGYEDLARVFGLRQVDSKSVANLLDFGYLTNFSSEVENHAPMSRFERFYTFGASNGHAPNNIPLSSESYLNFEQENASQLGKLRILCSFGGKILPRPTDGKLRYVGGETRIISIKKNLSWQELLNKTSSFCNQPYSIKYQLPGEDLDALISVSSDEDLENMKEEYNGLEGDSRFQRLRIFLIPDVESERQPTFEIASIQQSNPDYEYVYALNGMRDPSPQKIFAEPALNEVSVSMRKLDSIPSFHEGLLLRRREMNDCPSTSHPMHALQPSHAHSSRLAQQGNLKSGLTQWSKDKSHYDNTGGNDTFSGQRFYDQSLHNPNLQGNKLQFEAPTAKCSNIHVDHSRSSVVRHENRTPYHERSMSQIDDRSWILEYTKTVGSHQGMTHAFSDSQLQQHGEMYGYRSQEGIWDKQLRRSDDFVDAEVPKKMFEVDNLDAFDSVQLTTKNQHFKIGANSLEKSQTTNDLEKVIFVRQESHESNPSSIKRMNVISISPLHQQVPNFDELDIPYIGHNLDNGKVKDVAHEALVEPSPTVKPIGSILPSVSYTQNHHHIFSEDLLQSHENVEMQQYNLNPEALVKHVGNGQKIQGQISQFDQLSGLPRDLILHIPDGRLPVGYQRDGVTHETIIRYPVPCPPFACNIDNVESGLQKDEYCNMRPTQDKESFLSNGRVACFPGDKAQNARVGNVDDNSTKTCMPNQMDALHKHNGHNQLDPLNAIQEETNCMYNEVGCSSLIVPCMVEEIVVEPQSPTTIVGEGVDSKRDSEDVDPNKKQKSETMREVVMAEMEADSYGLQIIKNDDPEDLWEIGSGTYGTVFHGKWRGTDVAIKRIKKNYFLGRSSEQERLTEDFWREAQILSQLHHPNVVAFYGVVPDGAGGTLATVTEFMVNGSLRNALVKKDRPLDRHKKLMVVLDAAIGMEYLHSRNIVHFDLKCDNLLVNLKDPQRPICKVGDFGLSRIKCNTLVSGGVRGTLPWMAPELLNGSSVRVSEKVDVFSFGIVMWEILTGEEPYVDMHYGAIIGGIIKDTLRPHVPENCDPEWKKLMGQCWSSDPNSRPTFTEVAIKLRSMSISLHSKGHRPQRSLG